MFKNLSFPFAALCFALLISAGNSAQAATPFEKTSTVAGVPLTLNGAGTRYKVVFKVYDMGMYLRAPAKTAEAAIAQDGPKKLSFVALRKVSGTDLGLAFMSGMDDNSPRDISRKHLIETTKLIAIFSGKSYMQPGETFALEFVPGKGTTFFIEGQAQGQPIGDAEFFEMVLRIWLGPSPADWRLKDALVSPT
ncbi:chalcone isomerase family protein [Hydrogenophaga sp. PAMC20947]|uniref:chalcone isomerase family protein n=1 Tax=Hydrogenophaga sp. PAMC20947 TaxID=2565558 RepID=UPI0014466B82|nr:chalcone isomerase family protein [Hydrogenophaga sp. PAMC20947]